MSSEQYNRKLLLVCSLNSLQISTNNLVFSPLMLNVTCVLMGWCHKCIANKEKLGDQEKVLKFSD